METKVRHLTQRELADRWNKSEATIERYRSDGVGPKYLKIGGAVRYRLEDIEQFERACLHFSPDEPAYDDSVRFRDSQSNPRPQVSDAGVSQSNS
jgi:predicted DNA-binding transcriptional regulator AlpA